MSQLSELAPEVVVAGKYRLVETIGAGGTAAVWKAVDVDTGADIALKVLRDGVDPSLRVRAQREASLLLELRHPNLVQVIDSGEDDGVPFLAMELLEGEPLSRIISERGAIPCEEAVALVADVADGLGAAHARGVIHRDVKPGNIVCHEQVPTLVDFGIARSMDATTLTRGLVVGTASYIAPEQAQGLTLTPACDVYALGCVLYELLTGRPPFQGDSPVSIALKHVQDDPVPPGDLVDGIPAAIDAVVMRALAKDPAMRPADGAALAAALRGTEGAEGEETVVIGGAPVVDREPTMVMMPPVEPPPAVRRPPQVPRAAVLVGLAIAAVVLLAAVVGASRGSGGFEPRPVPDVTNAPVADAIEYLEGAGMEVDVATVESDAPAGIVVASDPPAGEMVHDGAVVLSVSSGPPATSIAPEQPAEEPGPGPGRGKGKKKKD